MPWRRRGQSAINGDKAPPTHTHTHCPRATLARRRAAQWPRPINGASSRLWKCVTAVTNVSLRNIGFLSNRGLIRNFSLRILYTPKIKNSKITHPCKVKPYKADEVYRTIIAAHGYKLICNIQKKCIAFISGSQLIECQHGTWWILIKYH